MTGSLETGRAVYLPVSPCALLDPYSSGKYSLLKEQCDGGGALPQPPSLLFPLPPQQSLLHYLRFFSDETPLGQA